MPEIRPTAGAGVARIAVIVARYNEAVTRALLDGAQQCFTERGIPPDRVDVVWVPGTFELPVVCAAAARSARYSAIVALGAVIRGETPHFDFIAASTSTALQQVATTHDLPVAFGVLTTEDLSQALARAGGSHGNKGYDAAMAALDTADVLSRIVRATD